MRVRSCRILQIAMNPILYWCLYSLSYRSTRKNRRIRLLRARGQHEFSCRIISPKQTIILTRKSAIFLTAEFSLEILNSCFKVRPLAFFKRNDMLDIQKSVVLR